MDDKTPTIARTIYTRKASTIRLIFFIVTTVIILVFSQFYNLLIDPFDPAGDLALLSFDAFRFGLFGILSSALIVGMAWKWPRYFQPLIARLIYGGVIFGCLNLIYEICTSISIYSADNFPEKIEFLLSIFSFPVLMAIAGILIVGGIYRFINKQFQIEPYQILTIEFNTKEKEIIFSKENVIFTMLTVLFVTISCPLMTVAGYSVGFTESAVSRSDICLIVILVGVLFYMSTRQRYQLSLEGSFKRANKVCYTVALLFFVIYPFILPSEDTGRLRNGSLSDNLLDFFGLIFYPITCFVCTMWCVAVVYGSLFHFGILRMNDDQDSAHQ